MTATMRNPIDHQIIKMLVSESIFCPRTKQSLDVRTCVVLRDKHGDPSYVLSQDGWAQVTYDDEAMGRLARYGLTVDESTVR